MLKILQARLQQYMNQELPNEHLDLEMAEEPDIKLPTYVGLYREGNGTPVQYSCLENPWMEEPSGLQSMGSQRVGHHWATSLSLFTLMHWRRQWQPTPMFLPGESQGGWSLVGCRLWGRTELDTTEAAWLSSSSSSSSWIIKQGHSRKTSSSLSLSTLKPLCGSQQTVENY